MVRDIKISVIMPSLNVQQYIEKAVKIITNLIKLQPFCDGNKRTFRATF